MTVPVVELDGAARVFPGPPPVEALKPADLRIERGDYLGVVGPSGSGKSTLLHLLGLLDTPTAGTYRLDGIDISSLSDNQRAGVRSARIGFVFQAFHLLAHRTAVENVMLAEIYRSDTRKHRRERAIAALQMVGLDHRLDSFPTTLSGGERQRVAVARALVGKPSLLLADEPTGNLDSTTSTQLLDLFDDLHEQGLTLVIITHDDLVSERSQRRVQLMDGVLSDA
jgi:putative ABC transport system ATP-binding protein